jgi:hypothetical protein
LENKLKAQEKETEQQIKLKKEEQELNSAMGEKKREYEKKITLLEYSVKEGEKQREDMEKKAKEREEQFTVSSLSFLSSLILPFCIFSCFFSPFLLAFSFFLFPPFSPLCSLLFLCSFSVGDKEISAGGLRGEDGRTPSQLQGSRLFFLAVQTAARATATATEERERATTAATQAGSVAAQQRKGADFGLP